MKAESIGS